MKIYIINDEYINYLHNFESKVSFNKNNKRAYIGIVLKINELNYFAPLSSPKEKHLNMKEQGNTYIKIKNGKLGLINLNNMIPVNLEDITKLVPQNKKYEKLIQEQQRWINSNIHKINKKAINLHLLFTTRKLKKNDFKITNNFKLLEKKSLEWNKKKEIIKVNCNLCKGHLKKDPS